MARLRNEPQRPVIACAICKGSLDDKEQFFHCLTCPKNQQETDICDSCACNDKELAAFSHGHPLVLVPKKNDIRSNVIKKPSPSSNVSLWREEPIWSDIDRDFGSISRSLVPEFDTFTRGWMGPLNQRFREFERIADRLDRSLRSGFLRTPSIFDDMSFPFDSRNRSDIL